jgi:hypothetical protein
VHRATPRWVVASVGMSARAPLSTPLSQVLLAFTIELDNELEHRLAQAGGGARVTSLTMWSNFLRFVGDGITVGELPAASGLQKARMHSTLGGMERWGYVYVAPAPAEHPPSTKRDGYGSARAFRADWVVRPTPPGRNAQEIWPRLHGEIEERWEQRFGASAISELRSSLRAIVDRLDIELPEFLPILGSANGLAADVPPRERRTDSGAASSLHLPGLLSKVLLAYTIDFESESELSLPVSANFVRVLDDSGVAVRELPLAAGVSKEATSIALTAMTKAGVVAVDGRTAATKRVRLTSKGVVAQAAIPGVHVGVEERWDERFGVDGVRRIRGALEDVLEQRDGERSRLALGLQPYPDGWRASKPYLAHTAAMIEDPTVGLPRYPMVLYRGGWPDGS